MPLRIAHLTSVAIAVPPRTHGGTEWVVHHLVQGLHRRGHRVELFASGDSRVDCPVHAVTDRALLERDDWSTYLQHELEAMNAHNLFRQADRFDVVHGHWPTLAPYLARPEHPPVVVTYHYLSADALEHYERWFPRVRGVFISRAQARALGRPDAPVIHNGVDVESIPLGDGEEDALVIVARMTPRKGVAEAIEIARRAGRRLIIIGPVMKNLKESRPYFEERVAPHIDGDRVRYIPELPNREVVRLVGRCRAFLLPLRWDEPFGMVVAEAMAAGTPVVAYRRGAMPELIRQGETGFLCETVEEAVEALRWVDGVDRRRCREWVAERFGLERMVDEYERLYRELVDERGDGDGGRREPAHDDSWSDGRGRSDGRGPARTRPGEPGRPAGGDGARVDRAARDDDDPGLGGTLDRARESPAQSTAPSDE